MVLGIKGLVLNSSFCAIIQFELKIFKHDRDFFRPNRFTSPHFGLLQHAEDTLL